MSDRVMRSAAERLLGYRRVLEARDLGEAPERLRALAHDEVRPVRVWVARNPATPPDALDTLARDTDETVRWNVLLNRHTSNSTLHYMAEREASESPDSFVDRSRIAHHPNVAKKLRRELLALGVCRGHALPCSNDVYARVRVWPQQTNSRRTSAMGSL